MNSLVGRDLELHSLQAVLSRAVERHPGAVFLNGPAGIGKTRLITEARLATGALFWLQARCVELVGPSLPFGPWREMLGNPIGGGQLVDASKKLRSLVGRSANRAAGFNDVFASLAEASDRMAIAIVIEDLHWADRSSLDLLAFIVHCLRDQRIAVLASFRSDHELDDHLISLLAELSRLPIVDSISLGPLSRPAATAHLARLVRKRLSRPVTQQLVARAMGNPRYLEHFAGALEKGEDPFTSQPPIVAARIATLPAPTRYLLGLLAAGRRPLPHRVVEAAWRRSPQDLAESARAAIGAKLVTAGALGYAIPDKLLAEAAYWTLTPPERSDAHSALADVLLTTAERPQAPANLAVEVVEHLLAADRSTEALRVAVETGRSAMGSGAFVPAERLFALALEAEQRLPSPSQATAPIGLGRHRLLELRARAASAAGDPASAAELLREAIRLSGLRAARKAELQQVLGSFLSAAGDDVGAAEALDSAEALAPTAASSKGARLLLTRAAELMLKGHFSESAEIAARGEALAKAHKRMDLVAQALAFIGVDRVGLGDEKTGLSHLLRALGLAERAQAPETVAEIRINLAASLCRVCHFEEALRVAEAGLAAINEARLEGRAGPGLAAAAAEAMFRLGRWPDALRVIAAGLEVASSGESEMALLALRGRIQAARGHFFAARRMLDLAEARGRGLRRADLVTEIALGRAELCLWTGRLDLARETLANALSYLESTEDDAQRTAVIALACRAEAEHLLSLGRRRYPSEARESTERLEEYASLAGRIGQLHAANATEEAAIRISVALAQAERDRAFNRDSSSTWESIAGMRASVGDRYGALYARWRAVQCQLSERLAEARGHLSTLYLESVSLGATPLRREIEALAARARFRLDAVPPPAQEFMPYGLTRREVEVLDLIAAGMTNREIGRSLFVTEKTAAAHVYHILSKLNAKTRHEAVAISTRRAQDG